MRHARLHLLAAFLLGALAACREEPPPAKPHPLEQQLKDRVDSARRAAGAPAPGALPAYVAPQPPPGPPTAGDFVEYRLGVSHRLSGFRTIDASAVVRLQAIEVTEALTRVHVSSPDVPGLFCGGVVFEVKQEGARPPREPTRAQAPTTVRVGERDFVCFAHQSDGKMVDGPRRSWCERSPDQALVLGDGVVTRSIGRGPRGGFGGSSIELLRAGHEAKPPAPAPLAFPPGGRVWRTKEGGERRHEVVSAGGRLEDLAWPGTTHTLLDYLLSQLDTMAVPPVPPGAQRVEVLIGQHPVEAVRVLTQEEVDADDLGIRYHVTVEHLLPTAPTALVAPWQVRCGPLLITRNGDELYRVLDWE